MPPANAGFPQSIGRVGFLGCPAPRASVGIGRLARRVIVAHRLLEPGAPAGHAVGQSVAEYAFHLAGGEVVTAPIRERFEIQVVPPGWGRQPFLAVTDTNDYNLPRFEGSWGEAGSRLMEHAMGNSAGYYLWCWENPHPERPVERIEFIPRGTRFIVAAITTSDVDEHPFVRAASRRCGSWQRTAVTASSVSSWTGVWRPIRSRCCRRSGARCSPIPRISPAGSSVADGGGYVTYVGQENRQHALGHMVLWDLKEPVMPWCSDGPDEAELGGALDVTLSDWADRAHAQGGTVVAAHFPNPNGEPAVLVATGRADAVEMLAHSGDAMLEYYRYLNSGYRLPLVGGTDKMSSAVPVGLYRTYARLDEEFSYEAWCRAVRAGRTFLSGGPLVSLSVDGHEPGGTVELSGPGTVSPCRGAQHFPAPFARSRA